MSLKDLFKAGKELIVDFKSIKDDEVRNDLLSHLKKVMLSMKEKDVANSKINFKTLIEHIKDSKKHIPDTKKTFNNSKNFFTVFIAELPKPKKEKKPQIKMDDVVELSLGRRIVNWTREGVSSEEQIKRLNKLLNEKKK